jgi:hypothetical protein
MDQPRNRWLDLLAIPIIVGVVVAFIQFGIPRILEKKGGIELSYSVEPPKVSLDNSKVPGVKVQINGVETKLLAIESVRVWNSSADPIKELPIQYVFDSSNPNFNIFAIVHETKPKFQFGKITSSSSERASVTFTYQLLNRGDEFTATFLTNEAASLSLYAKVAGLSLKQITPGTSSGLADSPLFLIGAVLVSLLSVLGSTVSLVRSRRGS